MFRGCFLGSIRDESLSRNFKDCHFLSFPKNSHLFLYIWFYLSAIGVGSWYGYLGMLRLGEGEVLGGAFRGHRGWGRALALPGAGASGYPTTRLSPDPLFGALLPPASGQSAVEPPRLASDPAHPDTHDQAPACGPAPAGHPRYRQVRLRGCHHMFPAWLGVPSPSPVNKLPRSDPRSRPLISPQIREKSSFLRKN